MWTWLFSFMIAFVTAVVATRLMIMVGIGDNPDAARKLHTKTTPTSGGVGICIGVLAGFGFVLLETSPSNPLPMIATIAGALTAGILGFFDDVFVLGPKVKLLVMVVLASVFSAAVIPIDSLLLAPTMIVPLGPLFGIIGITLWILVLVNCVNFMDGANGLSMGCSAIGLFGLCALLGMQGGTQAAFLAWASGAACLGFLVWNAGKGAIFAGDCGALFVGFLSAALGGYGVSIGVYPLCVALCFLPLLVDAILTIIWRLKHKQNILTPHNRHAYQRAIRAGATHAYTARRYWGQSLVCVLTAIFASYRGDFVPVASFSILLVTLSFVYVQTLRITAQE